MEDEKNHDRPNVHYLKRPDGLAIDRRYSGHDLLALALPARGLILPPASPHTIYEHMATTQARTAEDQG
jgi:hypothetical protein